MGSSAMADSHCGVVVALALCGEYVCSAGGDAMIKVWKADSLEFVRYILKNPQKLLIVFSLPKQYPASFES